jgi:stress response protein YsnF
MAAEQDDQRVTLPIAEEFVIVERRKRVTGRVRVHTEVHEAVQSLQTELAADDIIIERVPVGQFVDIAPTERREGDTTIIPVVEEVAVVEKRLRVVEEIRLTRRRATHLVNDEVTVRRVDVKVDRLPAGDGANTRDAKTP